MIGLGFLSKKAGQASLCLLALAAASGGLFTLQNHRVAEKAAIESCDSFLERKEIALGQAKHQQELLVCPPPPPPPPASSPSSSSSSSPPPSPETSRREEPAPSRGERPASVSQGLASWYGGVDDLGGVDTASGEPLNPGAYTAAHRTLPFGTKVRVTFLKTGKSTVVQVNDRGPFVPGRIIDISRAAAAEIGLQRYGVGKVTIEVLP
jgi:rare lipoprotein A